MAGLFCPLTFPFLAIIAYSLSPHSPGMVKLYSGGKQALSQGM